MVSKSGTDYLLLGWPREERRFAAEILRQRRMQLATVREEPALADTVLPVKSTPAAPVRSIVMISPPPAGADIEVDNVFVGHTPAELSLAAGERIAAIIAKRATSRGGESCRSCLEANR